MLVLENIRKSFASPSGAAQAGARDPATKEGGGTLQAATRTIAVDGIDLSVGPGETVALIGPSGCGKSTLLKLVVGLLSPDSGRVRVEGREVRGENLEALRHQMGYVIQSGGLFPHLTSRGNVALLARHLGWSAGSIDTRLRELADLTHLDLALFERYPTQLSGGQRQRVSLIRALMLDPGLLLLDEPLGALDPIIRAELQADLREIFAELGKTVVLVTHDLYEAAYFASRVVLLHEGRIAQEGSYAELRARPASDFVRRFLAAQRGIDELEPRTSTAGHEVSEDA